MESDIKKDSEKAELDPVHRTLMKETPMNLIKHEMANLVEEERMRVREDEASVQTEPMMWDKNDDNDPDPDVRDDLTIDFKAESGYDSKDNLINRVKDTLLNNFNDGTLNCSGDDSLNMSQDEFDINIKDEQVDEIDIKDEEVDELLGNIKNELVNRNELIDRPEDELEGSITKEHENSHKDEMKKVPDEPMDSINNKIEERRFNTNINKKIVLFANIETLIPIPY